MTAEREISISISIAKFPDINLILAHLTPKTFG